MPKVGVLGTSVTHLHPMPAETFETLGALLTVDAYDLLIVNLPSAEAGQAVRALRQDARYQFSLIYCCQTLDPWAKALSDGLVPNTQELLQTQWGIWSERYNVLGQQLALEKLEQRTMAWLWLRADATLYALKDSGFAQYYRYPLLEVLTKDEVINELSWVQLMRQHGWLEEGELINRLRLCGGCGSARLNYVDVCPECQALEISRQPSLHCFTCGHVGDQDKFLKDGLLLCPNCLSRLRHIGSDYDRPMENYRCQCCQAFFVDADVQAHCVDCGEQHAPDELNIREIRHFKLSEAGRLRCRQGLVHHESEVEQFGRLSVLSKRQFFAFVDWQIQLVQRYKNPPFSLLGVRFVNLMQTLERLGEMRGHALIDSLVERLQNAVRDTDRCCRLSDEVLWILLPYTDEKGLNVVHARLREDKTRMSQHAELDVEMRLVNFTAPSELLDQENAALLIARLGANLV